MNTDFGADFKPLAEAESYYPTRFEYMVGKILTGLLVGKPEKDHRKCVVTAMAIAEELESRLDSKKGG